MASCSLIWTRAASNWDEDAKLLPHHVPKIIRIPCIAVEFLPSPSPITGCSHAVVTSVNAVTAIGRTPHLRHELASVSFFCFGAKTRSTLQAQGHLVLDTPAAVDTAEKLCHHVRQTLPAGTRIAVLTAQQPAFAASEYLTANGFEVTKSVLYQTECRAVWHSGEEMSMEQKKALGDEKHVICFASPSAVTGFQRTFRRLSAAWYKNFSAVAIGATTQEAIKKLLPALPYETCPTQDLPSLIATSLETAARIETGQYPST